MECRGRKRKGVQLPKLETLWGLQLVDGYYAKLVVTIRSSCAPGAPKALETFGSHMSFIGDMSPQLQSVLDLTGAGMAGHRNWSKVPLGDLERLSKDLENLSFTDAGGCNWNIRSLEAVFGECPFRSASRAFLQRTVRLNLAAVPFPGLMVEHTIDGDQAMAGLDLAGAGSSPACPGPVDTVTPPIQVSSKGSGTQDPIAALLGKLRASISAGEKGDALTLLDGLEQSMAVSWMQRLFEQLGCVRFLAGPPQEVLQTRRQVNRYLTDSICFQDKLIGGMMYKPKFLLDCVLLTDSLREPSLLREVVCRPGQLRCKLLR